MKIFKRAWMENGEQVSLFSLVSEEHIRNFYKLYFGRDLDEMFVGESFVAEDSIWKRFA